MSCRTKMLAVLAKFYRKFSSITTKRQWSRIFFFLFFRYSQNFFDLHRNLNESYSFVVATVTAPTAATVVTGATAIATATAATAVFGWNNVIVRRRKGRK